MYPRPEVLAPGGDLAKLKTAVLYGADAIYCAGPSFGLRAGSSNLSHDELREAVDFAHAQSVKIYVTVNIYPRDDDMAGLPDYLRYLEEIGVDAVIVADPGIFQLIGQIAPRLQRHVSTQANITHAAAANFWHSLGATRVVLARELSLSEIIALRREIHPDLELECFVHGAMCMAYSGRCILSQHFTGRDANRGACSQPCRWQYQITEASRPNAPLMIEEDERGTYFMNAKDMCMIEHIPELVRAGIHSLKIEGRMKGMLYAAMTARSYRQATEAFVRDPEHYEMDPSWLYDLEYLVHRRYSTGFYFTQPDEAAEPAESSETLENIAKEGGYERKGEFVGIVTEYREGRLTIEQRGRIFSGQTVSILHPDGRTDRIQAQHLTSLEGEPIDATPHARMRYQMDGPETVPGTLLRTEERLTEPVQDPE